MEGPKRTEDKLNIVGIVAVGICSSVFVYVSVVLLQAFYMNETSTVSTTADYTGQGYDHRTLRAAQIANISEPGRNAGGPDQPQTYRIPIDTAMELIANEAKRDAANLVPSVGRATVATVKPVFGRPQPLQAPAGAAPADGTVAPGAGTPAPAVDGTTTTAAPVSAGAAGTPAPATMTTRPAGEQVPQGIAPRTVPDGAAAPTTPVPSPAAPAGATPAPTSGAPARRTAPAPATGAPRNPRPAQPAPGAQGGNAP